MYKCYISRDIFFHPSLVKEVTLGVCAKKESQNFNGATRSRIEITIVRRATLSLKDARVLTTVEKLAFLSKKHYRIARVLRCLNFRGCESVSRSPGCICSFPKDSNTIRFFLGNRFSYYENVHEYARRLKRWFRLSTSTRTISSSNLFWPISF